MIFQNQNYQKRFLFCCLLTFLLCTQLEDNIYFSEKSKQFKPYALLKGSCFDQRDLSLPGVSITIKVQPDSNKKETKKKWQTFSDRRGEFAARLPAGKQTFIIFAKKKGFRLSKKIVPFEYDEQHHIIIRMKPS